MTELKKLEEAFHGHGVDGRRKGIKVEFSELLGKTFSNVVKDKDTQIFFVTNKTIYKMFHDQDCCEEVLIEDVCGDLDDLIGSEILVAEETIDEKNQNSYDCETFTFYHLRTMKGTVTIRWHGESNGYYSERVDLHKVEV